MGQWITAYYGSHCILALEFPDNSRGKIFNTSNSIIIDLNGGSTETVDLTGDTNMVDLPGVVDTPALPVEMDVDPCVDDIGIDDLLQNVISLELGNQDGELQPKPTLVNWAAEFATTTIYNNGASYGKSGPVFIVVSNNANWILPVPRSYMIKNHLGKSKVAYKSFRTEYLGDGQLSSTAKPVADNLVTVLNSWKEQGAKVQAFVMIAPYSGKRMSYASFIEFIWQRISELTETHLGQKIDQVVRILSRLKNQESNYNLQILSSYKPQNLDQGPESSIIFQYMNKKVMATIGISGAEAATITVWDDLAMKWKFND